MTDNTLPYDPENQAQEQAYDLIKETNTSFFLTGRAGTGKTTFLKRVRECVKEKNFVVVAPTGIAAIVAGGETIHSFFGMPLEVITKRTELKINPEKQTLLRNVDTIIVDEASMVRCDLVDAIDRVLRRIMHSNLPFGGKQLIFSGDIFQLDPVVKKGSTELQMLRDLYNTDMPYFFKADVFKRTQLLSIEFTKVYRQEDAEFLRVLTHVRNGHALDADLAVLNERVGKMPADDVKAITLTSLNATADQINAEHLDAIDAEEKIFAGKLEGDYKASDLPIPMELKLKVGAQVMMCRNDQARRWVNGTIATVKNLEDDLLEVEIDGNVYDVAPVTWESPKYTYDPNTKEVTTEIIGSYTQLPVKLAWAITIHKSQGMTFDHMIVNLNRGLFMAGQLYVALSRVRSLSGLYLTDPIKPSYIRAKEEATRFSSEFNDQSAIVKQLEIGREVYTYFRKSDFDGAAKAYWGLMHKAIASGDGREAALMGKRVLDTIILDDCLFDAQRDTPLLPENSQCGQFVNALISLYEGHPEEAIRLARIPRDKSCKEWLYIESRALMAIGYYAEADQVNCRMIDAYENEFDEKCFMTIARTNDAVGDPSLGLYQRVIADKRSYLPALLAFRSSMLRKGKRFATNEEGKPLPSIVNDFADAGMSDDEWTVTYSASLPSEELSGEILRLVYE